MVKFALIKFESNLAVSIAWAKRENFKKWDKIIVSESEMLMLMRLWCKVLWKSEINYKEHKKIIDDLVKEWEKKLESQNKEKEKAENERLSKIEAKQKVKETEIETNEDSNESETPKTSDEEKEKIEYEETTWDNQTGNAPDEKPQV